MYSKEILYTALLLTKNIKINWDIHYKLKYAAIKKSDIDQYEPPTWKNIHIKWKKKLQRSITK